MCARVPWPLTLSKAIGDHWRFTNNQHKQQQRCTNELFTPAARESQTTHIDRAATGSPVSLLSLCYSSCALSAAAAAAAVHGQTQRSNEWRKKQRIYVPVPDIAPIHCMLYQGDSVRFWNSFVWNPLGFHVLCTKQQQDGILINPLGKNGLMSEIWLRFRET